MKALKKKKKNLYDVGGVLKGKKKKKKKEEPLTREKAESLDYIQSLYPDFNPATDTVVTGASMDGARALKQLNTKSNNFIGSDYKSIGGDISRTAINKGGQEQQVVYRRFRK